MEAPVTTAEINEQLQRILASPEFAMAQKRSELLEYLVKRFLANEEVKENTIGEALIPGFLTRRKRPGAQSDEPPTNVRAMATLLRGRLDDYYGGTGIDDPVLITISTGRGYKVKCSRRRSSSAIQYFERGRYQHSLGVLHYDDAAEDFLAACNIDPSYTAANYALTETTLLRALCGFTRPDDLETATRHLQHALKANPDHFKAQMLGAFLDLCSLNFDSAKSRFTSLLQHSPEGTSNHPIYAAYLMTMGDVSGALQIMRSNYERNPLDALNRGLYRLFLYAARVPTDHVHKRLIRESVGRQTDEMFSAELRSGVNWLDGLIEAAFWLKGTTPQFALRNYDDERYLSHLPRVVPGFMRWRVSEILSVTSKLTPLCLGLRCWATGDGIIEIRNAPPDHYPRFVWVMVYISCEKYEEAVAVLQQAVGEPWLLWINRWPFLDCIRDRPDFRALIKSMGIGRFKRRA